MVECKMKLELIRRNYFENYYLKFDNQSQFQFSNTCCIKLLIAIFAKDEDKKDYYRAQ